MRAHNTGDKQYFDFIQRSMDHFVANDGSIRTYSLDEYNIDNILPGRNLFFLYKTTRQEKYKKAAALLREQLKTHPRTSDGGFWHKKIYPWQMWLDGLYMGEPFYAEYAVMFNEPAAFDDIAKQLRYCQRGRSRWKPVPRWELRVLPQREGSHERSERYRRTFARRN